MYEVKNKENCIEWITGQETITVTLTQQRYINKVRKLKKRFPDQVKVHTNADGSILAKFPLSALRLSIIQRKEGEMSEQEKRQLRKRLEAGKAKRQTQDSDWD